jgi:hypothetical protein
VLARFALLRNITEIVSYVIRKKVNICHSFTGFSKQLLDFVVLDL